MGRALRRSRLAAFALTALLAAAGCREAPPPPLPLHVHHEGSEEPGVLMQHVPLQGPGIYQPLIAALPSLELQGHTRLLARGGTRKTLELAASVPLQISGDVASIGKVPAAGQVEVRDVGSGELLASRRLTLLDPFAWSPFELRIGAAPSGRVRLSLVSVGERLVWSAPRACPAEGRASAAPGVLVIVVDTLRADAVGAYGGVETPHLDRLARRGIVYQEARSTASWTVPSVATLMTGRLPGAVGALREVPQLGTAATVAEAFERAGVLAWGVSANPTVGASSRLARGFSRFHTYRSFGIGARAVTGSALALLAASEDHPLFLYVQYMDAHTPYARKFDLAPYLDAVAQRTSVAPEDLDAIRAAYHDGLRELDAAIPGLLAAARRRGMAVVVTSDHGEELLEHGFLSHGQSLFDELLRVPLVVVAPGEPARTEPTPVSLVDLATTVAELGGLGTRAMVGRSLLRPASRPFGQAENLSAIKGRGLVRLRAAWDGRYKFIRDGKSGAWRSYDLEEDAAEQIPAFLPKDVRARLSALVEGWPAEQAPEDPEAAEDLRARMRALGYLD